MTIANDKITALVPATLAETKEMSRLLSTSNLLPPELHGKEANVFVAIVAGRELGLAPMAALRSIHVIKGKPILSADMMVGIVLGSGLAEYFTPIAQDATSVTWETKRRGAPQPTRGTWTLDDAKRAGLVGGNWERYPRAMLNARCKSELARLVYPDVLAGCYDETERDEIERGASRIVEPMSPARPSDDVHDAEIVGEEREAPSDAVATGETQDKRASSTPEAKREPNEMWVLEMLDKLDEATSIDELKSLARAVNLTTPKGSPSRKACRRHYDAAMTRLAKDEPSS